MAKKKAGKAEAPKRTNGQGTVRQLPNGRWRWELTLGYDADGKRRSASGVCATETEAEKALTAARADRDRGILAAPDRVTVKEYAGRWLELQGGLRESSLKNYRAELGYALEHLGEMRLQAVKLPHLKAAVARMAERVMAGGSGRGKPMSGRTQRQVVARLKAVFKEATRDGLLHVNPADGLKVKAPPSERVGAVLSGEEAARFARLGFAFEAAGECRLWPALYTALAAGFRRGEVLGLRWEDVDFTSGVLRVRQAVTAPRGKGPTVGPLKTKGSRRDVPLPPSFRDALLRQRARQAAEREAAGGAWQGSGLVFTTGTGVAYHPDNLNRALAAVLEWSDPGRLERSGGALSKAARVAVAPLVAEGGRLPTLRVHDLRHTYATHALRLGVPVAVVSRLLGHAKISITLDVYRSVLPDELEAGALDLFAPPTQPTAHAARVEAWPGARVSAPRGAGRRAPCPVGERPLGPSRAV